MDRIITLLAALVALIALAGALLVQRSADATMALQSAELSALREMLSHTPAPASSAEPAANTADLESTIATLEERLAALETRAEQVLSPRPEAAPANEPAPISSEAVAALALGGPTDDCIPLGTRFIGQSGDSFPICGTPIVLDVLSVTEGVVQLEGVEAFASGSFANLPVAGCTVMAYSADASGFAEMRVSCT